MLVGDLMVRMAADMADLRTGFDQARGQAEKFGEGVGKAVDLARNALIALGVTASINHFVGLIQQSIEAADKLNDLAQKTGITVETLGGLEYAAKQSGTDMETLAKSSQKLSVLMAEAAGGSAKAAGVFEALGVSVVNTDGTLASMDDTLFAVADQFASYKDGPEKAALAQELFGKSGAAMIPLLNQGGDALRAAVAEYQRYGGVTTETAQRADAFNDTLEKVRLIQGAFTRELTAALLPTLQALANIFVEVKGKGSDFGGVVDVIVNGVKLLGIGVLGVVAAFQAVGQALGALAAAGVAIAQGNFKEAWTILKEGGNDAANTVSTAMQRAKDVWNSSGADMVASAKKNGPEMAAPIVKGTKDVADALLKEWEALEKLREKWLQVIDAQEGGFAPSTLKDIEELNALLATGELEWYEYNDALQAVLDKDPILKKEQDEINKLLKETQDILDKVTASWNKELSALGDQIDKQRAANATFGLGKAALIDYTIAQLDAKIAVEQSGDAYSPYAAHLEEVRGKLIELRDAVAIGEALDQQKRDLDSAQKEWNHYIDAVSKAFHGFINDWVTNGFSSAAKNAWENFKKWAFSAIAEITAKQIVVSIGASIGLTGGVNAGGLISGGGGGGLGGLGDIASGLGSLLTGSMSLGTAFTNLGTIIPTFTTMLEGGAAVGEALSASFAGMAASLGAVVPVIGAVVAAGYMLYNFLESKKGGPKEGGFATTGATPGIGGVDSGGRWFTPNQSDAGMLTAVQGINATYQKLLGLLGGTGSAVFAQGYSTDPKGTAPSNVHTGAWVNGAQIFDNPNGNVGRSSEELKAELEAQSMRAILSALKASDLPAVVAGYLASIDVSTATVEQITAALAHAAELKILVEAVSALPEDMAAGLIAALGASDEIDAKIKDFAASFLEFSKASAALSDQLDRDPAAEVKKLTAAHETQYEAVFRLRDELITATTAYDGSTEGTKDLTAATKAYIDAQVTALAQIETLKAGLAGMFSDSIKQLDWAVMNNAERGKFLMEEATKTIGLLQNTTDPAEIEKFSKLINKDLVDAFNLLSPEEQKTQHDAFVQRLKDADALVQAQLEASRKEISADNANAQSVLGNIRTAMDVAAAKQEEAAQALIDAAHVIREAAADAARTAAANAATAAVQATAASTMVTAANTPVTVAPITVNVNVTEGGP